MIAHQLDNGLLELRENGVKLVNAPLFDHFEAAIDWPHMMEQEHYAKHWLIIVGRQEDGVLSYFAEESGDLDTIGEAATNWKDRLLITRLHATKDQSESLAILRNPEYHDGLCEYGGAEDLDEDNFPMWWHDREHWPYFRDRDTYAPIVTVSEQTRANVPAGHQLIRRMIKERQAIVRRECQIFSQVIKQRPPLQDLVMHPLLRAAVWVTVAMERDYRTIEEREEPEVWYGNPRK